MSDVRHWTVWRSTVTRWTFDNAQRHVRALRPISEAARSWSCDKLVISIFEVSNYFAGRQLVFTCHKYRSNVLLLHELKANNSRASRRRSAAIYGLCSKEYFAVCAALRNTWEHRILCFVAICVIAKLFEISSKFVCLQREKVRKVGTNAADCLQH